MPPDLAWLLLLIGLVITVTAAPCGLCCAPSCWAVHGDEMDGAVSGVVLCGCFSDTDPDTLVTRYWNASNMVGVNGSFTLLADAPGNPANTIWSAVIGTVDLQEYEADLCTTPIGDPITVDVLLTVNCFADEGNGLQAAIGISSPLTGTSGQIFTSTDQSPPTYFQPGDVVPNIVICETDGLGYFTHVAAEGSLTIDPP